MKDIRIDEALWSSAMQQGGILQRWLSANLEPVHAGQKVAEILIEDARHAVFAPAAGMLRRNQPAGAVVEPGDVIGRIDDGI